MSATRNPPGFAIAALLLALGFLACKSGADKPSASDQTPEPAAASANNTAANKTAANKTAANKTAANKTSAKDDSRTMLAKVDAALSKGLVPFGDIKLQLELGRWTVGDVNKLLAEARGAKLDPSARLAFVMKRFMGTAFKYESQLPIPPRDVLRVRLETFDCAGFAIHMLALSAARDFDEFAHNLRLIRYRQTETRGVNSNPTVGNIFDFSYSVFQEAVERGFVQDVTANVAGGAALTRFRTRFVARRRTAEYDQGKRLIVPKSHPNEIVTVDMISRKTFKRMDRSAIKTGDILLFSRVKPQGRSDTLMVGHLGVAKNVDGEIYLTHATRDYVWRPKASKGGKPLGTRVYYRNDPRREQLGVSAATTWVTDPAGRKIKIKGKSYYGYHPTELRKLTNYIVGAHIQGIRVMRPLRRSKKVLDRDRLFRRRGKRVAPGVTDGTALIVDSAMNRQQAVERNLAKAAPTKIVRRLVVVDVTYPGFDGKLHQGQMVVHDELAQDVHLLFETIRKHGFPVASVIPMSNPSYLKHGKWDDQTSMAANNTSSFNYRVVARSRVLSRHACGRAIDLNPLLNPYIKDKIVEPTGAVYDPKERGTLMAGHPIVKRMKTMGWTWGGEFKNLKDYQHFEKGSCRRSR